MQLNRSSVPVLWLYVQSRHQHIFLMLNYINITFHTPMLIDLLDCVLYPSAFLECNSSNHMLMVSC